MVTDQEYNQGGYAKVGVKREYLEEVKTRTTDDSGKVYRGEAGKQLLRRKLERQAYYDRNNKQSNDH
jgi:hypothetical protein